MRGGVIETVSVCQLEANGRVNGTAVRGFNDPSHEFTGHNRRRQLWFLVAVLLFEGVFEKIEGPGELHLATVVIHMRASGSELLQAQVKVAFPPAFGLKLLKATGDSLL